MSENPEAHTKPGETVPEGREGTGQDLCPRCSGRGEVDGQTCPDCRGTGTVTEPVGGA